jgi:hypothetical protein
VLHWTEGVVVVAQLKNVQRGQQMVQVELGQVAGLEEVLG